MCNVVNLKTTPYDVYIGRPSAKQYQYLLSHYGNPFTHLSGFQHLYKVNNRDEAILAYKEWLLGIRWTDVETTRRQWILDNLHTLKDKTLGCFCKPLSCHGDILKELVDKLV